MTRHARFKKFVYFTPLRLPESNFAAAIRISSDGAGKGT